MISAQWHGGTVVILLCNATTPQRILIRTVWHIIQHMTQQKKRKTSITYMYAVLKEWLQ